jgi:hypothetical protein
MNRPCSLVFGLALALTACGGDDEQGNPDGPPNPNPDAAPNADADNRDLLVRLNAIPGVTAVEETAPGEPDVRLFDIMIEQPVDHFTQAPGSPVFQQNFTLVHRGFDRPMVLETTGYWNYTGYSDTELTAVLGANQIAMEHRFFYRSRPEPADWGYLTIEQSAADEHRVIEVMKTIYGASAWITTGASKGGMTASYHRRFYPDDVDGTVPYVAPLSFATGDTRYPPFLDDTPPAACRDALRALEIELLSNARFNALLTRAQDQAENLDLSYTRIEIGPALESAITGIEWAFWQYTGVTYCGDIPPTTATNAEMWDFLEFVSAVSGNEDAWVDAFEAYYYQASFQLGYPDSGGAFLSPYLRYDGDDYAGIMPEGVPFPIYAPGAMADIDDWVQADGSRFLFIYGEYDPWTAGRYTLGAATDSVSLTAPEATHSAGLGALTGPDRATAYEMLERWTGVTPGGSAKQLRGPNAGKPTPRIPPAMIHALRLRAAAAAAH